MTPLQTIGTYETKTHLADLLPAGSSAKRSATLAAERMRQFMLDAPKTAPVDIRALLEEGRD